MSAFYREMAQAGTLHRYFPEVLNIPPVGMVNVLIENLLPVEGRCLDEVLVTLRHKRLGSLDEEVFEARFGATSAPVVRHRIPQIAFTDFSYQYQVRVRLAADDPSAPGVRLLPAQPPWLRTSNPILCDGRKYLPFSLADVAAQPEVFDHVPRVDIELAPEEGGEPRLTRQVALIPASSGPNGVIRQT